VAGLVWWLDRRFKFGRGRAFALYVMAYTAGRCWIEMLRTDEATHLFGVRLNVFTSIVVFLGALAYFLLVKGPREYVVPIDAPETAPDPEADGSAFSPVEGGGGAVDGVSQVDVSDEPAPAKAPRAYQVVSEERFREYERTGILPPVDVAADQPAAGDDTAQSSVGSADER
jgi:hypothetical protein